MRSLIRFKLTLLYTNQWYYTYRSFMTMVRYYARVARLSSQKQMTTSRTPEAVEKQSRAMCAKAFEVGLFDPNTAHGAMLPRVWDTGTLLRSVPWLRLKNAEGRNIYIR